MLVHLYCALGGDAADLAQAIGELSPDTQLGLKLVIQSLGKGTGKFDLPYFPPIFTVLNTHGTFDFLLLYSFHINLPPCNKIPLYDVLRFFLS